MGRTTIRGTWRVLALVATAALAAPAQALCTSDGVRQPTVVLERFINADCATCWRDPAAPRPAANAIALDWVIPGNKGDDAPLAAVALEEAQERLYFLHRKVPDQALAVSGIREGDTVLRLAQGAAFNDYIGASIELKNAGRERWRAWLLLVERLPAGTEGSPVERNLVRNVFRPDWHRPMTRNPGRLAETRAMQIHEGGKPDRLRLVAVLHDGDGRIRAISRTECR